MAGDIKCPFFALGYNSNIIRKLGNFINFHAKIPDIFDQINGHFGLFKSQTLRLGEAGTTQTPSQTRRLRIAKINFKSVRKTIASLIARNDGIGGYLMNFASLRDADFG